MEQVMALRIFDHLLVNHGWNATGGIYTPATHVTTEPCRIAQSRGICSKPHATRGQQQDVSCGYSLFCGCDSCLPEQPNQIFLNTREIE